MGVSFKLIQSAEHFQEALRLEQAIIVICFAESAMASSTSKAMEKLNHRWPFFQLFPDERPESWAWLNGIFAVTDDAAPMREGIVWLKKGQVVEWLADSDKSAADLIARLTAECFDFGKIHAPGTARAMRPFDVDLLKILCCPETHQGLALATTGILEKLNQRIESGQARTISQQIVKEKLAGGLVRADGAVVYPMRNNIPILLAGEAIVLA